MIELELELAVTLLLLDAALLVITTTVLELAADEVLLELAAELDMVLEADESLAPTNSLRINCAILVLQPRSHAA